MTPNANSKLNEDQISQFLFDRLGLSYLEIQAYQQPDRMRLNILTTVKVNPGLVEGYLVKKDVQASLTPLPRSITSVQLSWVSVHDYHLLATPENINATLSAFGKIISKAEKIIAPVNGRLAGIWSGSWRIGMVITKPIPYNAWMGGRKVRVMYRQQTKRCGQCGLTAPEGCEYRANTEDCYNAGGARADLEQVWNIILARAKGEICPEDSVLRKENADRAEKRRVAEESSAAGELAGEDPVDPDLMPKPVDPAFYLSYPPIEVAEPRDPNPLRRPRRNSVRPGGRSRTNTVTETADEEEQWMLVLVLCPKMSTQIHYIAIEMQCKGSCYVTVQVFFIKKLLFSLCSVNH